jgi:hypothetical protein
MVTLLSEDDDLFLPTLLIIGVQKGGTTTLYELLNSSPRFSGSTNKETGFFSKDKNFNQGVRWYKKQFHPVHPGQVLFEATPAYFYYPEVPKRINHTLHNARLVVVFREPASRCYSAWHMYKRFNESNPQQVYDLYLKDSNPENKTAISDLLFAKEFPTFRDAVMADMERYESLSVEIEPSFVRRGLYADQLDRYLEYFSLSDFLFIEQRELDNGAEVLSKIHDFLHINTNHTFTETISRNNVGGYSDISEDEKNVISMLQSFYRPHNNRLFEKIGIEYDWNGRV